MNFTQSLFEIGLKLSQVQQKTTEKFRERSKEGLEQFLALVPEHLRQTIAMRIFGLRHIPMLAFLSPQVVSTNAFRMEVKIPLTFRSKNHWGTMYFGALAVGADTAIGLLAMRRMEERKANLSLLFKDFRVEYLKRAEGDTHFICDQGEVIDQVITAALDSGERVNREITGYATVPAKFGDDPVARFSLTLSLKKNA